MKRAIWCSWFVVLGLLSGGSLANAGDLKAIEISGNKRVDEDAIRLVIKSQIGAPVDPEQVGSDIKAIYGLGYFDDVQVETEETSEGDRLQFIVAEKPSVSEIEYRGNQELDLDKIKEVVDIVPLSVLNVSKIKKNTEKIRELYVEKGFFLADVGYELNPTKNNQVKLVFVITERSKVQIRRINLVGNVFVSDDELKGIMETREGGFFSWLTSSGTYKEEALKRDLMRISDYYYNHGYINVKVHEPIVEISPDRESIFISIAVEEGESYRFGSLGFAGELLVRDEDLLKRVDKAISESGDGMVLPSDLEKELRQRLSPEEIARLKLEVLMGIRDEVEKRLAEKVWEEDQPAAPAGGELRDQVRTEMLRQLKVGILEGMLIFKPGEVFNRMMLGMSLFRVQDVYKDRGYAYVEVVPQTNIDTKTRIVDLVFNIQRGRKVYIERIDVSGNIKTRDKVVRRQLRIYEGELYSGTGIETSQRRVNQLGFFEKVEISESKGSGPDRIVLNIQVKERSTGAFQIGAGFSSMENFIATAQVSQENLFGRGQTLALMAQLSSLRQYFSLNFVDSYFLDTNWYFAFSVYNMQLDYFTFLRKATGGTLTWGYEIFDDWRLSITYTLEQVDISTGRSEGEGLRLKNLEADGITSSVQLTLMWDTRDNRLFPTNGHMFQLSVEHASPFTLSENDFTRYSGVARWYFPLFLGIVLKTNLSVGYIMSSSDQGIPIFERYMIGGIYTVRGYEPRSLGPSLLAPSNGWDPGSYLRTINQGGNKQLIGNLELEFPILPQANIRGVLFLDAGNAYQEGEFFFAERSNPDTRRTETWAGLYWSTGFGFRWFSPIGPLRFEWGFPLTPRPGDKGYLFEFTIGNFF
jgi:outer membrane protein insertion porin family